MSPSSLSFSQENLSKAGKSMLQRAIGMTVLTLAAGLWVAPAFAQSSDPPAATAPAKPAKPVRPAPAPGGYYIEFRAARIGIYGHSYVAYGRLDRQGNAETTTYADLHPVGNYAVMAVGHFVPVPANTEWDPEVLELPIAHKYRVKLNDSQYNNLLAAVKRANANTAYWNAVTNNCNHYVGQLAEAVGLRVPMAFHLSMGFIPDLQEMNEASSPPMATPAQPAKPTSRKPAPKPAAATSSLPATDAPAR
jgi:hypothetical protein